MHPIHAILSVVLLSVCTMASWTCDPLAGQTKCDITTSCLNAGQPNQYVCACRAGYKATSNNWDIMEQFRLSLPGYEFLVFVPEETPCSILCDNHLGPPSELCSEVPALDKCPFE